MTHEINEENIRVAAYYIWEQAGRPEGKDKECWIKACEQLFAVKAPKKVAKKAVKTVADKITADYSKAGALYDQVDKMCDDMIKKISAFRDTFRKAQGHIGAAQNQLDNLSIRKLTKNNPTMKEKFEALENKEGD